MLAVCFRFFRNTLEETRNDELVCLLEHTHTQRTLSLALPGLVAAACEQRGLAFFDANHAVASSERDPIHWIRDSHCAFGAAMAEWVARAGLLSTTEAG